MNELLALRLEDILLTPYQAVCFLLWLSNLAVMMFYFHTTLDPIRIKKNAYVLSGVFIVVSIPVAYLKMILCAKYGLEDSLYQLVANIGTLWALLYCLLAFQDKLWKKMLNFAFFTVITCGGELIVVFTHNSALMSFDYHFNDIQTILYVTWNCVVVYIGLYIVMFFWRRILKRHDFFQSKAGESKRRKTRIFGYWLYLMFPVSQAFFIWVTAQHFYDNNRFLSPIGIYGLVAGVIADVVLVAVIMTKEKQLQLEQEIAAFHHAQELEQIRYEQLLVRSESVAKIRHDMNNTLTTVKYLLEQGHEAEAREVLNHISDQ